MEFNLLNQDVKQLILEDENYRDIVDRADELFKQNNFISAVDYYLKALSINQYSHPLIRAAECCFSLGKFKIAAGLFCRVIKIKHVSDLFEYLGICLQKIGHNKQASAAYLEYLRLFDVLDKQNNKPKDEKIIEKNLQIREFIDKNKNTDGTVENLNLDYFIKNIHIPLINDIKHKQIQPKINNTSEIPEVEPIKHVPRDYIKQAKENGTKFSDEVKLYNIKLGNNSYQINSPIFERFYVLFNVLFEDLKYLKNLDGDTDNGNTHIDELNRIFDVLIGYNKNNEKLKEKISQIVNFLNGLTNWDGDKEIYDYEKIYNESKEFFEQMYKFHVFKERHMEIFINLCDLMEKAYTENNVSWLSEKMPKKELKQVKSINNKKK